MKKEENGNRKPGIGNRTSVRILLVGIVLCSLVIIPVAAALLPAPTIITPANNYHMYNSIGRVTFAWKPVAGATRYYIECLQKVGSSDWANIHSIIITDTFHVHDFGLGTYKWRVTSMGPGPSEFGKSSQVRTFDLTTHPQSLATPIPISPPSGSVFYHTTPRAITVEWKPVLGADQYQVWAQYYDPFAKSWIDLSAAPDVVTGTLNTVHTVTIYGPTKGRWCVQARDITGAWADSKYSTWRTFEFKN